MEAPWIEVGGVVVRAPMTAGTSFLLSVQCAVYFGQRRRATSRRAGRWGGFFAMMALATLAGVFKHGAQVALSEVSLGRWLNHIDVAHLVMGVSFYLIHRGLSRSGSVAWS